MRRRTAHDEVATISFLAKLERGEVRAEEPYKIGRITRNNGGWRPNAVAGDTATRQSLELGSPRVRDLVRNTPQFKKARGTLVDLVCGCGVQAYCDPFTTGIDLTDASGVFDSELRYASESDDWFERWADSPKQCDAGGKMAWWDIQRAAFGEMVETGDAILLRCNLRERGRLIPVCYQLIEREQLDRTKDRPAGGGQNKIVNGIELDSLNREVAFHIYDAHPDDNDYRSASSSSTPVPASRVLHTFLPFRPSMNVGFSWFHAMAQNARDRDWLMGNYLVKVALDAAATIVHYTDDDKTVNMDGEESGTGRDGKPEVRLAQGAMTFQLPTRDEIKMFNSGNTPPQQLPGFVDVIDHDAAAGIELSHLAYSGRWSKLSYTAGRGAQLDDERHCKPLRRFWGTQTVVPVRQTVNTQLVATGRLSSMSSRVFETNPWQYNNHLIVGPGREYLDPEGESDSARSKLGAGLSTLQIELGKLGLHWVRVLRQIQVEEHLLSKLGISLDYTKGGGQQPKRSAGQSTTERKEAEQIARRIVDAVYAGAI
jgi:lambda family phage portal protein